jgi:hypothetical protein
LFIQPSTIMYDAITEEYDNGTQVLPTAIN